MELKTLKDFEFINAYIDDEELLKKQSDDWKGELKAEAIKWVKRYRRTPDAPFGYFTGKIDILMHFFNLTEADLSDESDNEEMTFDSSELDVLSEEGRI